MSESHTALKHEQIDILKLLYKYRFGSRQLLANSLGVKANSSLYEKLRVLIRHGLVASRYDTQLRLQGVPVAYYLTPTGLRALRQLGGHDFITEAIIRSSYRDKKVSQQFINHTLAVYQFTNDLKKAYEDLKVYLRRDMNRYSYFPNVPPDAFLSLKRGDVPSRFFLDIIPGDLPRFALERRITSYLEFFDAGGWDATQSKLPKLLLVTENSASEKRARRAARRALNRADMLDEIAVYTTTFDLLRSEAAKKYIWSPIVEIDELLTLTDM